MIMNECFEELDKCNHHITFVAPESGIGEGMLIELGYAKKLGLQTLLLMPKDYHSISSKAVVDKVMCYTNMNDLLHDVLPQADALFVTSLPPSRLAT